MQLELSGELGFGFCWVRVSFVFSSDSRAAPYSWALLGAHGAWRVRAVSSDKRPRVRHAPRVLHRSEERVGPAGKGRKSGENTESSCGSASFGSVCWWGVGFWVRLRAWDFPTERALPQTPFKF